MGKPLLLPCPFCGKSDAFVERLDSSSSMVICQAMVDEHLTCMARGPVGIQDDDGEDQPGYAAAVREWNARAQAQQACVEDGAILVSVEPLRRVLNALVNSPHEVRELQATREPVALFADNPINVLIAEFNAVHGGNDD